MNNTFQIKRAHVNNLQIENLEFPLHQIVCLTGKSGSGKSTLAFDVIYAACQSKILKNDRYEVLDAPDVFALQQKTHTRYSSISVAKFIGLQNYILANHGTSLCEECQGSGVVFSLMRGILNNKDFIGKIKHIASLHSLYEAIISHSDSIMSVLRNLYNDDALDPDTNALLRCLSYPQQCQHCHGTGLVHLNPCDVEKYFSRILNKLHLSVADLTSLLDLYNPINIVGATRWQWIRLIALLMKITDSALLILDEPMAGMSVSDSEKMMSCFENISAEFNSSIILIEHSAVAIQSSDYVIEIGPGAGIHGGHITFSGPAKEFLKSNSSIAQQIPVHFSPITNDSGKKGKMISIKGVNEMGFHKASFSFPFSKFSCISGNTETGKTNLLLLLGRAFDKGNMSWCNALLFGEISGRSDIRRTQFVTQNPIGNNPHSIPATYIDAMLPLRKAFSDLAVKGGDNLGVEYFSFNSSAGMCRDCHGYGGKEVVKGDIELWQKCPTCGGNRYNSVVQKIKYMGLSIGDFLQLTSEETIKYEEFCPGLVSRARLLNAIGLGYLTLGQASTTLSGGEAQRVKLGKFLARVAGDRTLFLLDTPSKGLSLPDIHLLLQILKELSTHNTVIIADNNPLVMNNCDYLAVLRKTANGNSLLFAGHPSSLAKDLTANFFMK